MAEKSQESWTSYAKRLAAGKLGLAAAYALSSQAKKPKKKTQPKPKVKPAPVKKTDSVGVRAGKGMRASRDRYEEAARISRGG